MNSFTQCVLCCLSVALPAILQAQPDSLSLGAGYNSVDRQRPAQFSGKPDQGGFMVGGLRLSNQSAGERHWTLNGTDLGLDTARLEARYGKWGSYRIDLRLDQLPYAEVGTAYGPLVGAGSAVQTLPAGWVGATGSSGFTALDASLQRFDLERKRQRLFSSLRWQFRPQWALTAEYRHESKEGSDSLGAIFGSSGGNPRGVLLARPVDFTTTGLRLGLDRSSAGNQYGLSLDLSQFENSDPALRWSNPYNNPQWVAGAGFSSGAIGQLALEPDNKSRQWHAYAGFDLSAGTRVTGSLTGTRLSQDDDFLPYSSVVAAPVPLPRADLGGEVDTLEGMFSLSSRLGSRAGLRVRYSFRDRDNRTPQAVYQRVPGDAAAQAGILSEGARVNRVYDQTIEKLTMEMDYRLSGRTRMTAGYLAEENDRGMVDVEATVEQAIFLKLDLRPFTTTSGWVKWSVSEREAKGLDPVRSFNYGHNPDYVETLIGSAVFHNDPFLRRFHINDRDRQEVSGALSYTPSELVGFTLQGRYRDDVFPATLVGLTDSDARMLALDAAFTPAADWNAGLYYSVESFANRQLGFSRSGGGNPTPFYPLAVRDPGRAWRVESADLSHTIGGSVDWFALGERLELSLDASHTDARTETDTASRGLSWLPLPDVVTRITSLSATGTYQLSPGRRVQARWYYERYRSSDFALDGVMVDTLANVLLMGNASPRYSGHVFTVSFTVDLR